jgi:hypothetical protein
MRLTYSSPSWVLACVGILLFSTSSKAGPNCNQDPPPPACYEDPPPIICKPPIAHDRAVRLIPQETNVWCWAASGQMVMEYMGVSVNQCSQVNDYFGRNDCCNTPTPSPCFSNLPGVLGGWPEFEKHGLSFLVRYGPAAVSWQEVREMLAPRQEWSPCWGEPIAFAWAWPDSSGKCPGFGGGHMMVARGYRTVGGTNWIHVNDPWPPGVGNDTMWITYDWFVEGVGHHCHWRDYYHFYRYRT